MTAEAWKALTAALAFLTALVALLRKEGLPLRGNSRGRDKTRDVSLVLQRTLFRMAAHRLVVVKATNGGGRPSESRPVFTSALVEAVEKPIEPVVGFWTGVKADDTYEDLLRAVIDGGEHTLLAADVPAGSALRDIYEASGILVTHIVRVLHTDAALFYLVSNYTEATDVPEADRARVRACAAQLREFGPEGLESLGPA